MRLVGRHVFGQQVPADDSSFDFGLEHREDIAVDLRFVGEKRSGRVQNPRIDLPSRAPFQAVGARQIRDPVVSLVPVLQASTNMVFRRPGLEPHECVGIVVIRRVVLRRKVIRLGFSPTADALCVLIALVHVMRDRAEIVEELAEQVPALLALHHVGANQQIARFFDSLFQKEPLAIGDTNVAEPLVGRSSRSVIGVGRRRKPSLVDATAIPADTRSSRRGAIGDDDRGS